MHKPVKVNLASFRLSPRDGHLEDRHDDATDKRRNKGLSMLRSVKEEVAPVTYPKIGHVDRQHNQRKTLGRDSETRWYCLVEVAWNERVKSLEKT